MSMSGGAITRGNLGLLTELGEKRTKKAKGGKRKKGRGKKAGY